MRLMFNKNILWHTIINTPLFQVEHISYTDGSLRVIPSLWAVFIKNKNNYINTTTIRLNQTYFTTAQTIQRNLKYSQAILSFF